MSYESRMLSQYSMPKRQEVERTLLQFLLKRGGAIKEFAAGEELVDEIAAKLGLSDRQRTAFLETVYRKENRVKKAFLWHRLLFRAADSLAARGLVSRPSETLSLTNRREWLLTEKGFNTAVEHSDLPTEAKGSLAVKSYETQKIVNRLVEAPLTQNYDPIDKSKRIVESTKKSAVRSRGFRLAVLEAYDYRCAVCGLKMKSPDSLLWEAEAAHIVPNSRLGRDDVCNAVSLCRLHHWAFDVGLFTLLDDYTVAASSVIASIPSDFGKIGDYEFFYALMSSSRRIWLPKRKEIHPHPNSILWHRRNVFHK